MKELHKFFDQLLNVCLIFRCFEFNNCFQKYFIIYNDCSDLKINSIPKKFPSLVKYNF